ncbi:MAG TPA: HD domain-containing phosphohydrolase [Thermoanaerobaculia bacterium]|nr:HD domain-containing phosphohydrolase [Thermoanaerobaculia bacterium]
MTDPVSSGDAIALRIAEAAAAGKGQNALVFAFYQLFRTAQIHAIDNQALVRPIQTMVEVTSQIFLRDGRVSLQTKDRALFLNGTKLKLTTEEYEFANRIFEFFRERGMIGFEIDGALTPDNIHKLLAILIYAPPQERTFKAMDAALKAAAIPFHPIKPVFEIKRADDDSGSVWMRAVLNYSKLVVLYRSLMTDSKATGAIRQQFIRKIARTVQTLVDIALEDHRPLLGAATSVRKPSEYASHHAANVCCMAISIGKSVGVGKVDLADLGVAAVFHDIGLRTCPAELLEKGGALDNRERAVINQHPIRSVEYLLEERRFTKSALSRIVVAFEHHRTATGSGYPPGSRKPDLFSRIVTIADVFDALTSQRPWRKPYPPDVAIHMMLRDAGQQFDEGLLKSFINLVGLYPPGTLVRTDAGEIGVVIGGGDDPVRVSRPLVLILDENRNARETVDLLDRTPLGGYRRTIVGCEDPSTFGIRTSGFVLHASPA